MNFIGHFFSQIVSAVCALVLCPLSVLSVEPLRIGHFPNVTHAQALIAHGMSRQGKGWFEARLKVPVEWYTYNAGPSAMEALLAGSIDIAYVGPNPALNLYLKSKGRALKVIAGSAHGGAGLVVRPNQGFVDAHSLKGKRIATPQFGNTQDVAARAWFKNQGVAVTQTGGEVFIIPTEGPDQLTLFMQGDLDGVWAVEPWLSRLVLEAGAQVLVDEKKALTTVVVASSQALSERRALVAAFVKAHAELSQWIIDHPAEAKQHVLQELKAISGRELSAALIDSSWARLSFQSSVTAGEFQEFVARAQQVGFLKGAGDVQTLVEEVR